MPDTHNRAILLILDGWGIGKGDYTDAIAMAKTPVMDELMKTEPHTWLKTYGENVGLPEGQMGNSEVGHLNIGAGRIVYQMLAKINKSISTNEILNQENFKSFLELAAKTGKNIHLMGLVSNGGVHSSDEHLKGICNILRNEGVDDRTYIHAFLDGRDCDPHSGVGFVRDLLDDPRMGRTKLATISGRYYAMDRDKRWNRIKLAYDAMAKGKGVKADDPIKAIEASYAEDITDEFVKPVVILGDRDEPLTKISDGDLVLCFNFRTDRGRQITTALTQQAFNEQDMSPLKLDYFTMTEYDKNFQNVDVIFHKEDLKGTLGEHLQDLGRTQLRAAETEKYPHVTFFFSGGRETEFEGESRILVPSPKVATYDLKPEMSAIELKTALIDAINSEKHDFLCVNFANPDMVGHTGIFEAIKIACETIDGIVGEILETCNSHNTRVMIIADHGNADHAINSDGSPNTAHSTNPVPCIIPGNEKDLLHEGVLADVAPTLLKMMNLPLSSEMTGTSLF
jgi:2,3-bisphosphoglycerate-independent phosphoglycerate mutase